MTEQAQESTAQQTSAEESQPSNDFAVPEAYAEKGWAKTIGSYDDLWKTFDNTQSLIGKRNAPANDAPQEQWDSYYDTMRPKDASEYEFASEFEGLPEGTDLTEAQDQARQLAHEIGLTPRQAKTMFDKYMGMELTALNKSGEQNAQQEQDLDKQFDEIGNELFGDKFGHVSSKAQSYLRESLPDSLKDVADTLGGNPKALLAMIALADKNINDSAKIKQEYGAEDKLASGTQAGNQSIDEINGQLNDAKKRYSAAPPFSQERKNIQGEIDASRAKLKSIVR